jgi:parallel beta-helix repeat protein
MHSRFIFRILTIISLPFFQSFAATYYVAANGNDSATYAQAQNQATPWKSLVKINAAVFSAGDSVLFRRGDIWRGTLVIPSSGVSGKPVYFGAYGSGAAPLIKGTEAIGVSWTLSGNTYQATVSQKITALFSNSVPLTLARYPNRGYLTITDTLNATTVQCNSLGSHNFLGATMHVRTSRFTIISKTITSSSILQKTLTLSEAPAYGLKPGWGFFINNSLSSLDTAGEWFYDSVSQKLYLMTPANVSPSTLALEASVYKNGIEINGKNYVTIQGLAVSGQAQNNIWVNNASNIVLNADTCMFADACGIMLNGSGQHNIVSNCQIQEANEYGILSYGNYSIFSGNTIRNIALIGRFTRSGMADYCCSGLAIRLIGNNDTISNNRIDSIGFIGIRSSGTNNTIMHNFITRCCVSKDDGAGIYTGYQDSAMETGSAGTTITENIILNTRSANDGTPDAGYTPGEGIYIDDYGHDITITGNTTAGCANHGIYLHHNKNITVKGNISYNNKLQFGFEESPADAVGYTANNRAADNVFYSITQDQQCMGSSPVSTTPYLVTTDSNYYCNPYNDAMIAYNGKVYTLDAWRTAKGLDLHSKVSLVSFLSYHILDTAGTNKIVNGTFVTSSSQWAGWPAPVAMVWEGGKGLDSGCLKVLYKNDSLSSIGQVSSPSFALSAGKAYQVSFSVISNKIGTINLIARQAHAPWTVLGLQKSFIMNTSRKNYSTVFYATATDTLSRLDFSNTRADSLYWLDNVSLYPVDVEAEDPQARSVLFYNPSLHDSMVNLGSKTYKDLDGNHVSGFITLAPFRSCVLVADSNNAKPIGQTERIIKKNQAVRAEIVRADIFGKKVGLTVNLPSDKHCSIGIYDFQGKLFARLFEGTLATGSHTFSINRNTLPAGIYCWVVNTGNRIFSGKIVTAR